MSKNFITIKKWDPAAAHFIEKGIRPLVFALNTWPLIETKGSCEGHRETDKPKRPYVQFRGPYKLVEDLRKKNYRYKLDHFKG